MSIHNNAAQAAVKAAALPSDAMDHLEHANDRATNAALAEAAKHLEGGSHGL